MNWERPTDPPDLTTINSGQEFSATSRVTPEVFNLLVQALLYLGGDISGNMAD